MAGVRSLDAGPRAGPQEERELLHDDGGVERAERDPDHGAEGVEDAKHRAQRAGVDRIAPDDRREAHAAPEREVQRRGDRHRGHGRPEGLAKAVGARLLPAEVGADAHEHQEHDSERLDPGLVEGRPHRDLLARERLADERERRGHEDEEEEAAEDPVIEQERELAREDRLDARPTHGQVEPRGHAPEDHFERDEHGRAGDRCDERDPQAHRQREVPDVEEPGAAHHDHEPPGGDGRPPEPRRRRQISKLGPAPQDERRREGDEEHEEHGEVVADRRLRERVNARDHPGAGEERAEDREKEHEPDEEHVPDLQEAAPLLDHHRVHVRAGDQEGHEGGVLDGVPAPVAAPPERLVGPEHPERVPDAQEHPREERPLAARDDPLVVQATGDQRGDPERERDRAPDEARVEAGRVDHHPVVLQGRVEPVPVGARPREVRSRTDSRRTP